MSRHLILILTIAVTTAGLAACSGDRSHKTGHREMGMMEGGLIVRPSALYLVGMDTDGDFRIERAELDAGTVAAFKAADANRSGFLTPVELSEWSETLAGDRYAPPGFIGFDANADQKVTPEEFGETLGGLFKQFDRNADGVVIRAEMVERLKRGPRRPRTTPDVQRQRQRY